MSPTDLEGIKALLDVHMEQIRRELRDLKTDYGGIREKVNEISNHTNVAIERINGDLNHLGTKVGANSTDIKNVMQRIELHEDVEVEKWNDQEKINEKQKEINAAAHKASEKKLDIRTTLMVGGTATLITIIVSRLADWLFGLFVH